MKQGRFVFVFSLLLSASIFVLAADQPNHDSDGKFRHVLLISVDGLHALGVSK